MQFQEREFLPVILGADITAYSLARSFHEEYGIKSLVLSMSEGGYIANSDIIENRVFEGLEKKEVLVERLLEVGREFEGKKKLIVLGCGDWYVRALIESKAVLQPYYIVPYIDEELLNKIVLKDKFYEIFEELGLDYPETYTYDYKFLIQDKIPGDDTYMRVLTCYCDQNSKVRFASLGRTLLEDHTPTAIGNPVAIINEVNPEIVTAATKFLEHIGYVGFANFDIKYDRRDGKYKFFEINVRLGRSNFYVTGSGFNTVKWIVDDYIYNNLPEYTVADNINLYTVVPKGVIMKYVSDPELKAQAKALFKAGKVSYPLLYKADKNLKHWFYAVAALFNQYRKFHKYF